MTVGSVAGLIAALAFVALVVILAVPVFRLGGVLKKTANSIEQITEHTIPILDHAAATIEGTNSQLAKVDTITTAAAEVSQNVSALTALFSATVGGPLIRLAAFTYGVRTTMSKRSKKDK